MKIKDLRHNMKVHQFSEINSKIYFAKIFHLRAASSIISFYNNNVFGINSLGVAVPSRKLSIKIFSIYFSAFFDSRELRNRSNLLSRRIFLPRSRERDGAGRFSPDWK
jgi:hypothetical protein